MRANFKPWDKKKEKKKGCFNLFLSYEPYNSSSKEKRKAGKVRVFSSLFVKVKNWKCGIIKNQTSNIKSWLYKHYMNRRSIMELKIISKYVN